MNTFIYIKDSRIQEHSNSWKILSITNLGRNSFYTSESYWSLLNMIKSSHVLLSFPLNPLETSATI